jgi:hypothetical protein
VHSQASPKPSSTISNEALDDTSSDSLRILAILARADTTIAYEAMSEGDLNGDGRDDYLVLARDKRPSSDPLENSYNRKVFIILNAGAAGLHIAAVNENLIGCTQCGGAGVGDPFQEFEAYDQGFSVTQLYGACSKTEMVSTFEYVPTRHDWMLNTRDTSSYSCQDSISEVHETHESPRNFGQVKFADASL